MEELTPNNLLLIAAGMVVAQAVFTCVLLRWIFQVEKKYRYEKANTQLLAAIALEKGVDPESVKEIINDVGDNVNVYAPDKRLV